MPLLVGVVFLMLVAGKGYGFELGEITGSWSWKGFVIEISPCQDRMCATVTAGPKNVGMELFASDLEQKGAGWVGQVADPETGAVYFTRLTMPDAGRLKLDGCTKAKVCLSGEFVRRQD